MEKEITHGELASIIQNAFEINEKDFEQYSPLTLAYIGDGFFELIIRTYLVEQTNEPVKKLHSKASSIVKAETQAKLIQLIQEDLTEDELRVYKRGRNAKSSTTAKNAGVGDYRKATGLEALFGYLYLKGNTDRALYLVKLGFERLEKETNSTDII